MYESIISNVHEVTRYVTKDGHEYSTLERAKEHVTDKVREYVASKLEKLVGDTPAGLTASQHYVVVVTLLENFQDLKDLEEVLNNNMY